MAQEKPKKPKKPRNYTVSSSSKQGAKPAAKGGKAAASKAGAKAEAAKPAAAKAASPKAGAAKPAAPKGRKPAPNMQERMEGLQGWMAEIERKQGRMTYFGAAAAALAVLASAAALYLALSTKNDAATKDDLDQLQERVDGIQQQVKLATEQELKGVNETLGSLDQRLEDLKKKQAQDAADIATLQAQPSGKGAAAGAGAAALGTGTGAGAGTGGGTNAGQ